MAVRWWFLLVILAATERTSCQNKSTTEPDYIPLGYFKKSDKLLNTLYHQDYQDTVEELVRAHRNAYPDLSRGFHKKASRILDHEMNQDYHQSIDLLSPMIGKRRVRSQKMRREKLNIQGVRSHRAHSLESGRRRRLQPDSQQEDIY